ncbi:Uncharacterised protein [Mycobacteroides abscessus subsp. massiliense]|nr:Uncharacterised protein [Mycobacteroides abscessus subsp. massiliense]
MEDALHIAEHHPGGEHPQPEHDQHSTPRIGTRVLA